MKIILSFIIILFLSVSLFAQSDTTCFTDEEILNIDNKILELEYKNSIKDSLVQELKYQIVLFEKLHAQDSIYILLKNYEVQLKDIQIQNYKELYTITKPSILDSKYLWFGFGVATILTSSWIVSNIR